MCAESKRKDPDSVKGSQGLEHFWGWQLGVGVSKTYENLEIC